MKPKRITNSRWAFNFTTTEAYMDFVGQVRDEVTTELAGDDLKVRDSANKAYDIVDWTRRAIRISVADDLINNTLSICQEYNHDLVFVSFLSDSSPLCQPFQNKIYSISGTSTKYPPLAAALWKNGGGLIHPNCRHTIEPYFEGETELDMTNPPKGDIISLNYSKRQTWLRTQRQVERYAQEVAQLKQMGVGYTEPLIKMEQWKLKRDKIGYDFPDVAFGLQA